MRVPNKVNTKPFERLLKWKRKDFLFALKGRRRKGKRVLFRSGRRREIEAKKVPFYREKGHKNKTIKVLFPSKEREGESQTICFYHKQGMKAGFKSGSIGV